MAGNRFWSFLWQIKFSAGLCSVWSASTCIRHLLIGPSQVRKLTDCSPLQCGVKLCSEPTLHDQPLHFLTSTPPFVSLLLLHIFLSPQKSPHVFSPRSHWQASHYSPSKILMGLQGPSRSNYVEQLLSLTGPWLPGENTNLPGKQNSPTFDKTLNTRGRK